MSSALTQGCLVVQKAEESRKRWEAIAYEPVVANSFCCYGAWEIQWYKIVLATAVVWRQTLMPVVSPSLEFRAVAFQLLSTSYSALICPSPCECVFYSPEIWIHAGELLPGQSAEAHLSTLIPSADVQTNNESIGACRCFVLLFLKYILFS